MYFSFFGINNYMVSQRRGTFFMKLNSNLMTQLIETSSVRAAVNDFASNFSWPVRQVQSQARQTTGEWLHGKMLLICPDGVIDRERMDGDMEQICWMRFKESDLCILWSACGFITVMNECGTETHFGWPHKLRPRVFPPQPQSLSLCYLVVARLYLYVVSHPPRCVCFLVACNVSHLII